MGSGSSKQKPIGFDSPLQNVAKNTSKNTSKNADVNKPNLFKIEDLIMQNSAKTSKNYSCLYKNRVPEFAKIIGNLRQDLTLVSSINENSDFIPAMSDMWLTSVSKNLDLSLDLLAGIVLDLRAISEDKKSKIDGKLDYIFEKFALAKNQLDQSSNFARKIETSKSYALKLFKPVLEELNNNPLLLAIKTGSSYKTHPELQRFKKMMIFSGKNTIKIIDGNIDNFVKNTESIFTTMNEFFNLGKVMLFAEIHTEYEKMDIYAKHLQETASYKLSRRALDHFRKKEEVQYNNDNNDNIKFETPEHVFDAKDFKFMVTFDDKDSKFLIILANLHNFTVDLFEAKEELRKYDVQELDLIKPLETYLKLSYELSQIIDYMENKTDKIGGKISDNFGDEISDNFGSKISDNFGEEIAANFAEKNYMQNPPDVLWVIVLVVVLILLIIVFLWKIKDGFTPKQSKNIPLFNAQPFFANL